jgi:hypothetical protein
VHATSSREQSRSSPLQRDQAGRRRPTRPVRRPGSPAWQRNRPASRESLPRDHAPPSQPWNPTKPTRTGSRPDTAAPPGARRDRRLPVDQESRRQPRLMQRRPGGRAILDAVRGRAGPVVPHLTQNRTARGTLWMIVSSSARSKAGDPPVPHPAFQISRGARTTALCCTISRSSSDGAGRSARKSVAHIMNSTARETSDSARIASSCRSSSGPSPT